MENPETPTETVAPPAAPQRRRGFRSGGGDGPIRKAPWALVGFLMVSLLTVIFGAYTWAAREERRDR